MKNTLLIFLLFFASASFAEDGSRLWLRYEPLIPSVAQHYKDIIRNVEANPQSETTRIAVEEFISAFQKMTGETLPVSSKKQSNSLIFERDKKLDAAYTIKSRQSSQGNSTIISSPDDIGFLYGVFHLLRLMQTNANITYLDIHEKASFEKRILNHWDNIDGSIERGYAGNSLWNWEELPENHSSRYIDYARANASIGINGTVLNNVNANPKFISHEYLLKVAELAKIFRPYGLKVYLSVNFSSPALLGGLPDSDPLNPKVRLWWKDKVKEIYSLIPDFGGFLVKANSEGQPGPQNYGRTHADGANMLAEALEPYRGIVMWRAFVYSPQSPDRAKQAYEEFVPLDGKFHKNVIIQVKNGPVDYQPREPFSPLFGAMQKTPLMVEFQITQEYLGFSKQLVYLAPLFEECLHSDTYSKGKGSTIAKVTDGTLFVQPFSAIAGVANTGNDTNWTGHHFAQSNWYCFGRLAWNHGLSSEQIADEWLKMTFSNEKDFVAPVKQMMLVSREATVNYMMPLGLAHLFAWHHHYGPEPWCNIPNARPDWLPSYYHKADSSGIGFDRTINGSNAVSQYFSPLSDIYNNIETCPENLILWFHHIPWEYRMRNGKTLWDELCFRYQEGIDSVRQFQKIWDMSASFVDKNRFEEVQYKLKVHLKDAIIWKDACTLYFQTFSQRPIPYELERPANDLEEMKAATRVNR